MKAKLYGLIYRLRHADADPIRVDTRGRTAYVRGDENERRRRQVCRLRDEFDFVVQLEINLQ